MTKKQDFYPLPGFPIEQKFTSIEKIHEYLNGEKITCLICGRSFKGLLGHIPKHGVSSDEYKDRFGLPFRTGLTSTGTKKKNKENGKKSIARLGVMRSMIDRDYQLASLKTQRKSELKVLQRRVNFSKATIPESPFSIEDAYAIFKHMVDFDVSLKSAVKATGIMCMTSFWKLLKRFPEELILEYEEARSRISKGKTNPLIKNQGVIDDVIGQINAGVRRKVIAEKYGIRVEYVTIIARGSSEV